MIDEETLAGLLADHAERIPVPESAIDSLLASSPPPLRSSATRREAAAKSRLVVTAATVSIALGAVWAYTVRSDDRGTSVQTATVPTRGRSPLAAPPTSGPAGKDSLARLEARAFSSNKQAATTAGRLDVTSSAGAPAELLTSARMAHTATLELRIGRGGLGETIGHIATIATSANGFVADADTAGPGTTPAGTVTIRVPSASFAPTIERLRALGTLTGTVRSVEVGDQPAGLHRQGRDVADQVVYATITISVGEIGR